MKELQALLDEIASQGRNGDTMLAHINPQEAELLKALGGAGTTNPETGLPEFWGISIGGYGISTDGGGSITTPNTSLSVNDVATTVTDAGRSLDQFVREEVPGGWAGAILIAAGVYYAPEIGAYFNAAGEEITAEQAAAATAEAGASAATPELTAAEVNALIAQEQAANMSAAEINAMIAEEAATAAAATPSQVAAAKAAGMSTLDYLRGGLLLNAVTGDPLGLGGGQPSSGGGGSTGFGLVPIPKEWQIPTYASTSAPIDLNSIFSKQDMLGGTQWQGLPSQQNTSFNDIFAANQQQTPMGTPVDINQIVSSILGQAATSQKSA
jgi:hypothetical protein